MLPRRCLAVFLVAMVFPAAATDSRDSGQPAAIIGRVVDAQDGSGLPGVPIRIAREGRSEPEIIAATDIRGAYAIRDLLPAADYVIRLDYPGFAPAIVGPLVVIEGESLRLDVTLRSTAEVTSVSIGGRWLEGVEKQLYLNTENHLAETVRARRIPGIDLIVWALQEIQDLADVVQEDAREALRRGIEDNLVEVIEPGDPFIFDLLRDPDPVIQSMAIHIFFNQDTGAWLKDPKLRALLQELLQAPGENTDIVTGILIAYVFADRFDEVRPIALSLVGSADIESAHEAASVIAWSHERGTDIAGLLRLLHEAVGVLRQEAAIWLAGSFHEALSPDERSQVAWELARTMEDSSLPPDVRGDAIMAARWLQNHPFIHDALLGLLEPDAWFPGVPGSCRPRHSLVVVLDSLDTETEIPGDLLKLRDRLQLLEADHRGEVEAMIDKMLAQLGPAAVP